MSNPLFYNISDTDTSILVIGSIDSTAPSGVVTIESEEIFFSDCSDNKFLGCTRGYNGTTAVAHTRNTICTITTELPVLSPLHNLSDPTLDQDAATKKYVDDNSGGGTPAGANTEVQFNDSGSFGADSTFHFNSSTKEVACKKIDVEATPGTTTAQIGGFGSYASFGMYEEKDLQLQGWSGTFSITPDGPIVYNDNNGAPTVDPSAAFDLQSTTRGFLPPRLTTTQRNAISSPAAGLIIYNSSTNKLNFFNGTTWEVVTSA